jgi:phosphoglycerate dehydrogenase-like enzyme
MRILYVELPGFRQPWFDEFRGALPLGCEVAIYDPASPFAEQVKGVRAVVDQAPGKTTAEMVEAGAQAGVELWQFLSTGLDQVDVERMTAMGLKVANTPGQFSAVALAEHALMLMLCFAKQLSDSSENVRRGVFYSPLNFELSGACLGIAGLGASGTALARIARALGMTVRAIDAIPIAAATVDELGLEWVGGPRDLPQFVEAVDYLSLHMPLMEATRRIVDRGTFKVMRDSAVLINVARGGLVCEDALIEALENGFIRGAGLDVFASEPLDPSHPLLHLSNVIATPHVAGMTSGTATRRGRAAAENVARLLEGRDILYSAPEGLSGRGQ